MLLRVAGPSTWKTCFSSSPQSFVKSKALKKEIERQRIKAYEAHKALKSSTFIKSKPDPILGYSTSIPNGYLAWHNCELKQLILQPDDVWSGKLDIKTGDDDSPSLLNFGLTEKHKELLFEALPQVSSQRAVLDITNFEAAQQQKQDDVAQAEEIKKRALARILDLRNANAKGIEKVNKLRIMKAFSPPAEPGKSQKLDPGCSEVQAAITTYRIHAILDHAWSNTRDVDCRRHLSSLVMLRMKILKYLQRTARDRYLRLLPRIGLEPRYLREELIIRSKLPLRPGEQLL